MAEHYVQIVAQKEQRRQLEEFVAREKCFTEEPKQEKADSDFEHLKFDFEHFASKKATTSKTATTSTYAEEVAQDMLREEQDARWEANRGWSGHNWSRS